VDNLKEIIIQCQKNNARAQKKIYQHFAPRLFGVCLQYCKDRTEAEDNLQEGFIKVFTHIKKYRFEGSFEGWIRRIIVNTIIESFRKKNTLCFVDYIEDIAIDKHDQADITQTDILNMNEILHFMENLPPKYKLVFNLYALEGLSHNEIANMLNISVGTSKSNLARARKILKNKLTAHAKNKTQRA
jgi:RNA polymerase sigma-70 factor (ECF subfamily)